MYMYVYFWNNTTSTYFGVVSLYFCIHRIRLRGFQPAGPVQSFVSKIAGSRSTEP